MFRRILEMKGGWAILCAAAVALFVVANVAFSTLSGQRLDLTQDRLHTLSSGTRTIIEGLEKPMSVTLYYSKALGTAAPTYGTYSGRVKDMLRVFESVSGGTLKLTIKDPKPFSEVEDEAVELGMQGVPLDNTGDKVYFGIVAAVGEKKTAISFVQIERERFLEYDLARLIQGLAQTKKPVLAVHSARPMFGNLQMQMRGMPSRPWALTEQLQAQFDLRQIFAFEDLWKEKPDALMIVHPGDLDDKDFYHLDQYLLRGGRAMIFVDPYNEAAGARQLSPMPERVTSNIDRLLDHWGVEVVKDKIAGDRKFARMVNAGTDKQVIPAPYMSWLSIKREGVSPKDVVTSTMNLLNLQSAGIIRPKDGSKLTFEPLITTTEESQAMDVAFINAPRPKIIEMWEAFKPSGERLVLAARLTGRTKSMFPDGPPKEKKEETKDEKAAKPKADKKPEVKADKTDKSAPAAAKEDAKGTTEKAASEKTDEKKEEAKPVAPPFVAESTAPMNIILVADTDMLENRAWVQTREFFGQQVQLPFANNADFVVNVAENLAGGAALASLRSRGTARRPFTKIDDLRLAAENKFRTEERQLQNRLGDAEKKLDELRKKKKEGASVDTAVQAAVDEFTKEILGTRKELRRVQLALREDIEKLKGRLVFFNIALVPLLVGILALVLGALRIRRHRLATQAQEA
jgi:ABC-type uncharacterized transport system involved in gliding motility auxiliary subunit